MHSGGRIARKLHVIPIANYHKPHTKEAYHFDKGEISKTPGKNDAIIMCIFSKVISWLKVII